MARLQASIEKNIKFNRAFESLPVYGEFKKKPEDFVVTEHLPFSLSGEGEHCWVQIQKQCLNTDDVAQRLAGFANVKPVAIGYAGLKDRQGITTQWFSVQLPGKKTPDWRAIESEQLQILESRRHSRKLQRGALSHNSFSIRLRNVTSIQSSTSCFDLLSQRCEQINEEGVPNYFGPQRFGRDKNNLDKAMVMLKPEEGRCKRSKSRRYSRHTRGLLLSAARSWMFNHILSRRIAESNWNRCITGDVFMLNGKSACFRDDSSASTLERRLAAGEIHPTSCLWGEGENLAEGDCLALEMDVINRFPVFRDGLIAARAKHMRRALRVIPEKIHIEQHEGDIVLRFDLPAGAYATMVLDELICLQQPVKI